MVGGFGTSKPLLKDLVCLKVTPTKWYRLGLQLNISENELDKIKANNSTDVDSCILEMFKTWLRNTPDATYAELKDALDRIGEHSVAAQLLQPSGRHMKQSPERVISLFVWTHAMLSSPFIVSSCMQYMYSMSAELLTHPLF